MKRLSFFLKLAVSGLLLFFLFDRIDLADVYTVYKQSNHMLLIGAFALVLLGESLCVVRLRVLLALRNAFYSFNNFSLKGISTSNNCEINCSKLIRLL